MTKEEKSALITILCILAALLGGALLEIVATLITGYGPYF